MEKEIEKSDKLIESLSPIEVKIVPYLNLNIDGIVKKSELDKVSVLRALRFLENKGLAKIDVERKEIIDLGINGIYYKKNHLPERRLLILLEESNHISFEEAAKFSKLTDNEFKAALGALKKKGVILDRKSLSNLAEHNKETFERLVKQFS